MRFGKIMSSDEIVEFLKNRDPELYGEYNNDAPSNDPNYIDISPCDDEGNAEIDVYGFQISLPPVGDDFLIGSDYIYSIRFYDNKTNSSEWDLDFDKLPDNLKALFEWDGKSEI